MRLDVVCTVCTVAVEVACKNLEGAQVNMKKSMTAVNVARLAQVIRCWLCCHLRFLQCTVLVPLLVVSSISASSELGMDSEGVWQAV